jgi:hypothetical protein
MIFSITILTSLVVSGVSLAAESSSYSTLPQCSSKASTPCKCPVGTQYLECVTVGVIGADIFNVEDLVNDCKLPRR